MTELIKFQGGTSPSRSTTWKVFEWGNVQSNLFISIRGALFKEQSLEGGIVEKRLRTTDDTFQ